MNTRRIRPFAIAATALAVCLCIAPAARAAEEPPTIDAGQPWPAVCFALLGTVLVCLTAFKNAHRTHLD